MQNIKKYISRKMILSFFALLTLLVPVFGTYSQEVYENRDSLSIRIEDVSVGQNVYFPGDNAKGSVTLVNDGNADISNARYEIHLVGDFQDGGDLAESYYESELSEPFFLGLDERKILNFDFDLPRYKLSDKDVGFEVRAQLDSGTVLAWKVVKFDLPQNNTIESIDLIDAYLTKGEVEYHVQEGPTVYEDETLYLIVDVENNNSSEIRLSPKVTLYDRAEEGKIISEANVDEIILTSGSSHQIEYNLDNSLDPGVYVGVIEFENDNGSSIAQPIEFRYIVDGDIATISSVIVDKMSVNKGDDLTVTVFHTGNTFDVDILYGAESDINLGMNTSQNYTISVEVLDSNGNIVASGEKVSNFFNTSETNIPLVSKKTADQLFVQVSVSDGENILASYNTELPKTEIVEKDSTTSLNFITIAVIAVILILAFLIIFMNKRNKISNSTTASSLIAIISVSIAGSIIAWSGPTGSNSTNNDIIDPITLSVNSIPVEYEPGETINLSGNSQVNTCNNLGRITEFRAKIDNGSWTRLSRSKQSGGGDDRFRGGTETKNFSSSITAPTAPGTYTVYVRADLDVCKYVSPVDDCRANNWLQVSQQIIVREPAPEPGVCGSADGRYFSSEPTGSSLCSSGAPSSINQDGDKYTWNCEGTNGDPNSESCSTTRNPFGGGGSNDTPDITLNCSVNAPSNGITYQIGDQIVIQAILSGDTGSIDESNVVYNWKTSSGVVDSDENPETITFTPTSNGFYGATVEAEFDGESQNAVCLVAGLSEFDDPDTIVVADPPPIDFEIKLEKADSNGQCQADWTIGDGDPVTCVVETEFGAPVLNSIKESGDDKVNQGNEYRLNCALDEPMYDENGIEYEIPPTQYYKCVDTNSLIQI
jgi:hypothetical protein